MTGALLGLALLLRMGDDSPSGAAGSPTGGTGGVGSPSYEEPYTGPENPVTDSIYTPPATSGGGTGYTTPRGYRYV